MNQKRKLIQSWLILIFSASASPTSIIGYKTSFSSISVQSSRETESLQLRTVFTSKEDLPSSSTYFVTVPPPASTPLATTVSSSTESQTASASPTSIIGYSTSSSSISVQSLWDTESLQLKIQSTIKGDSLSSSIYPFTTVSSNTGPQRPSAPPANVSGHNTSSTSIFVHWDQVPAAHQNGAILYYTVTYTALPSGSVQTRSVSAPANQTTLSALKKYTNYSITVSASTIKGAGNVSAPIFIVTDEDRPSAPPANVSGYNTSSTTIFVQWDQVPAAHQNGVILYYTITYELYFKELFSQTVVVDAPTTQTTLTGLFQGTLYSISVSASTSKGNGASFYIYIGTGCARKHIILNGTNGEIIFHSYFYHQNYQYYRYNRTCSWKIMADKGEQVKLVLKCVEFTQCGFSCNCSHLEMQNGTYGDGSNTTRMCGYNLGNVEIYSRVGHGLRIQAVTRAFWWVYFWASYTVVSHKDTVSDECSNYIFLNESNRAMTYAGRSLGNLSDSKLSGWYRFSGGAGTQMAEACPKMYSCNTNSSGWLHGTHPTVAEGIVKRKVCFSQRVSQFLNDCCNHSKNISVRNCGAFYVYRLDPPDNYSRYCGNGLPRAPGCSNYKLLNESSRAVTYNHSVFHDCDESKLLGWYRFGGEAGTQMADTCVTMRHCGASYPGWLNGGHPSVSDGAVLRKVCFTGYQGCCYFSAFISVRNCNGFYVYKLSPLIHYYYYHYSYHYICSSRYCSSNGSELPTTGAKPPTTDNTETPTTTTTTITETTTRKSIDFFILSVFPFLALQ
ncbi:uncharacterized protein LOC114975057 isoform X6 [Acropora millepora]|uniref:uncharacterized protein LOC114975057 isoform X6 n=1 Tax=Acropora millepora TaxID=45264 RepID=UPI001CF5D6E0|nr:uncharacterized protein LOC114975057 isoform X6 [Acropora millepora]